MQVIVIYCIVFVIMYIKLNLLICDNQKDNASIENCEIIISSTVALRLEMFWNGQFRLANYTCQVDCHELYDLSTPFLPKYTSF